MPRLPRITGRDLLRALWRDGWYELRVRGSHHRLAHPDRPQKITVAVHAGAIVKAGTLQGILDDAGMTAERLLELLQEQTMRRYSVLLVPDPDEGGYSVQVPALPSLHTQGESYDDALRNARDAIAFHLECLEAEGEPIPEESAAPELATVDI